MAVRAFVALVLLGQTALVVNAYGDPHRRFGFQPFRESSTWEAEIVRVTADGREVGIDEPWPGGYRWDDLVGWSVLQRPDRRRHAYASFDSSVEHLSAALDWVADHTPLDTETVYLEARVEGTRNTRGPIRLTLRSETREEAG